MDNKNILNKEFIDNWIRLLPSELKFSNLFDISNEENIVDEEFTHNYLISNNKINDFILDYYFKCTNNLITDSEFLNFVKSGYIGEKNRILKPYSTNILGAYHRRCDLVSKLSQIVFSDVNSKINDKEVVVFQDLEPYFIDYKNGFKNGYDNFESNEISKYLTLFADKEDYVFKVYDYITKSITFRHSWVNPVGFTLKGSSESLLNGNIVNGFENGMLQGGLYKAWSIVFSRNNLFAPLFENLAEEKSVTNFHDTGLKSLLIRKNEIKDLIKKTKKQIDSQELQTLKQKERAEKGQDNTLAFEQRQTPLFLSELNKLESELRSIKINIKLSESNSSNSQVKISQNEVINTESENLINTNKYQNTEEIKNVEAEEELHNHIFKGNAFKLFQKYHLTKQLAENSKTDLSLLFQLFTIDSLFVDTVELKHYIRWLNNTYDYNLMELKKTNIKSKPNIQRTNDYKEYKSSTLK